MKLTPDNEPAVSGRPLMLTDEELERLSGRWVAIDGSGSVKFDGASFDDVYGLVRQAGIDVEQVQFACLPKPGLIA